MGGECRRQDIGYPLGPTMYRHRLTAIRTTHLWDITMCTPMHASTKVNTAFLSTWYNKGTYSISMYSPCVLPSPASHDQNIPTFPTTFCVVGSLGLFIVRRSSLGEKCNEFLGQFHDHVPGTPVRFGEISMRRVGLAGAGMENACWGEEGVDGVGAVLVVFITLTYRMDEALLTWYRKPFPM